MFSGAMIVRSTTEFDIERSGTGGHYWAGVWAVPLWRLSLPAGQGFCMHMRPFDAPEMKDVSVSPELAAAAVNRGVERMVLDAPGQYLWGYARDKQPRAEG